MCLLKGEIRKTSTLGSAEQQGNRSSGPAGDGTENSSPVKDYSPEQRDSCVPVFSHEPTCSAFGLSSLFFYPAWGQTISPLDIWKDNFRDIMWQEKLIHYIMGTVTDPSYFEASSFPLTDPNGMADTQPHHSFLFITLCYWPKIQKLIAPIRYGWKMPNDHNINTQNWEIGFLDAWDYSKPYLSNLSLSVVSLSFPFCSWKWQCIFTHSFRWTEY